MDKLILATGVLFMFFVKPKSDVYWPQWMFLVITVLLFSARRLKVPLSLKLLFTYVVCQCAIIAFYRPITEGLSMEGLFVVRYISLQALAQIVFLYYLFSKWKEIGRPLSAFIVLGGFCHAMSLIIDQLFLHLESGVQMIGLMGNRSIGATFTAFWIFFAVHVVEDKCWHWAVWIIGVIAIACSNSSISFAALGLGVAAWYLLTKRNWKMLGIGAVGAGVASMWVTPRMFLDNPRYHIWKIFYDFWTKNFNWWVGSGGGTFQAYGYTATQDAHYNYPAIFLWAHSDWLQIALEYGIIGFVLAVWAYGDVLWRARKKPYLFGGMIALAVTMIGNYPLENAPCALLVWCIFAEVLGGENERRI